MLRTFAKSFVRPFVMDKDATALGGTPPDTPIACKIPGFYCIRAETKIQDEHKNDIATIVGKDEDWDILTKTAGVCDRTKEGKQKCTPIDVSILYDKQLCNGTVTTLWKNRRKNYDFPGKS